MIGNQVEHRGAGVLDTPTQPTSQQPDPNQEYDRQQPRTGDDDLQAEGGPLSRQQ